MTVDGVGHTKRADAGAHIVRLTTELLRNVRPGESERRAPGQLAGLRVEIEVDRRVGDNGVLLVPDADIDLPIAVRELADDPAGTINRLERRIQALDGHAGGACRGAA